jgi:hypothetical protein
MELFCATVICVVFVLQGFVADDFYFVVKELLMTERTYKKDLEVVAVVRILVVCPSC